jgi:hypothetical protein
VPAFPRLLDAVALMSSVGTTVEVVCVRSGDASGSSDGSQSDSQISDRQQITTLLIII